MNSEVWFRICWSSSVGKLAFFVVRSVLGGPIKEFSSEASAAAFASQEDAQSIRDYGARWGSYDVEAYRAPCEPDEGPAVMQADLPIEDEANVESIFFGVNDAGAKITEACRDRSYVADLLGRPQGLKYTP